MAVFCFRCKLCGAQEQAARLEYPRFVLCECGGELGRDYRAEAVGLSGMVQLRREREVGGSSAIKNLFLPDNREFAGPGDPDGSTGMAKWRESHGPKESNKRPQWPGEVPKRVLSGFGGRGRST